MKAVESGELGFPNDMHAIVPGNADLFPNSPKFMA
jgi:hypothetical protein